MKITNQEFLDLLHVKEDEIIDNAVANDIEIIKQFKEVLFSEVHNQRSLDSFITDEVSTFTNNKLTVEYVFKFRKTVFRNYINDVLEGAKNGHIRECEDMDKVYVGAGYRYLLQRISDIETDLLTVFSIRELHAALSELDSELELDSSEYSTFEDKNDLVENFVSEIISQASTLNDIINIEGCSKRLCEEYFGLEL